MSTKYTVTKFTVWIAQEDGPNLPLTAERMNDMLEGFPFRRVVVEEEHRQCTPRDVRDVAGLMDTSLHDGLPKSPGKA